MTWDYSNQDKFYDKIGLKAISWPLTDTDQINSLLINNSINFEVLKKNLTDVLFVYSLSIFRSEISFALYAIIIAYLLINKKYEYLNIFLSLFGCFVTSIIIYFIFYSPSFIRSIFFINSILALIFTTALMLFLKYSNKFINRSAEYFFILPTIFFLSFFIHKNINKNLEYYKSFFKEGRSLESVLLNCDDQNIDCKYFKFLNNIKKNINMIKFIQFLKMEVLA